MAITPPRFTISLRLIRSLIYLILAVPVSVLFSLVATIPTKTQANHFYHHFSISLGDDDGNGHPSGSQSSFPYPKSKIRNRKSEIGGALNAED